jgi:oxalate decarboxylase/phosphoglucose isomerase-like protein (cupin superfamily)
VYSITAATGVILDLDPGGMRKLHRHPNADGWQYVIDAQVAFFYAEWRVQAARSFSATVKSG